MSKMTQLEMMDYVRRVLASNNQTVYMLSGIGRPLTQSMINTRIKMNDKWAIANKDMLVASIGKYVYDCVGLFKSGLWSGNKPFGKITYVASQDQNVRMMWNAAKVKGQVKNEAHPDRPGILVMTDDLGHVGMYMGVENGKRTYIECTITGGANKVIKSYGYKGKKHTWARWAEYAELNYVDIPKPKPDPKPDPKPTPGTTPKVGDKVTIINSGKQLATVNADGKKTGSVNHAGKTYEVVRVDAKAPNPIRVRVVGTKAAKDIIGWFKTNQIQGASTPPVTPPSNNDDGWVVKAGTITLNSNVWERNNPVMSDKSGMILRKKGDKIKFTHLKIAGKYEWLKQTNGKVIPWRVVATNEKWGTITYETVKPKPVELKVGDEVEVLPNKNINFDNKRKFTLWYKTYYIVTKPDAKGRTVIGRKKLGGGYTVTSSIHKDNLKKV